MKLSTPFVFLLFCPFIAFSQDLGVSKTLFYMKEGNEWILKGKKEFVIEKQLEHAAYYELNNGIWERKIIKTRRFSENRDTLFLHVDYYNDNKPTGQIHRLCYYVRNEAGEVVDIMHDGRSMKVGRGPDMPFPRLENEDEGMPVNYQFDQVFREAEELRNSGLSIDGHIVEFRSCLDIDVVIHADDFNRIKTLESAHRKLEVYYRESAYTSQGTTALFHAYPNPFEDILKLRVQNDNIRRVEVVNSLGARCYSQKIAGQDLVLIDLSDRMPGMYYLYIYTDQDVYSKKVIKN